MANIRLSYYKASIVNLQSQSNLAEYYAAFFLLFAVLEFNKSASSTILNGLGLLYVYADLASQMHQCMQLLTCLHSAVGS